MRHNKKINHLGRTKAHRAAMLSNMAVSLINHKRIFTTTAKAKALRTYIEPLITKSKASTKTSEETMHDRRVVFAMLQDKHAVAELFSSVADRIGERPGGYTRIVKTGARLGDNASMCFIELVDFNENMLKDTKKATAKTRRSRRKTTTTPMAESSATPETQKGRAAKDAEPKKQKPAEKTVETDEKPEITDIAASVEEMLTVEGAENVENADTQEQGDTETSDEEK
ncbi:MAG: 50S ribosomal protein L17 [Tannerella sp.]|jgi:large subunit ribosomal protein L17|nr:50S ribosomal protein L17 [Tannerella sp.]